MLNSTNCLSTKYQKCIKYFLQIQQPFIVNLFEHVTVVTSLLASQSEPWANNFCYWILQFCLCAFQLHCVCLVSRASCISRCGHCRPGFKYYLGYFNNFQRQGAEFWNAFGNTLGKYWYEFENTHIHWLKYTHTFHQFGIWNHVFGNKYLKIP